MINGIGYIAFEALLDQERNNAYSTPSSRLEAIIREARGDASSALSIDDEEGNSQANAKDKSHEDF